MKKKLLGILLCLPILGVMPSVLATCHRGGDTRNASSNLSDNLLAGVFILGIPMAFVGMAMIVRGEGTKR
jgi:hypothetical protein